MQSIFTTTATADTTPNVVTDLVQHHATMIVDHIKNEFGKGELFLRCLSLNSSGTGRCKTPAARGGLFCSSHSQSGVIASPELKAANQLSPKLLGPLVSKATGGVFESKAVKDAFKAKTGVKKLAKSIDANQCKKTNGQVCTTPTRNADGYCHHHRGQVPKVAEEDDEEQPAQIFVPIPIIESDEEETPAKRTRSKRKGGKK